MSEITIKIHEQKITPDELNKLAYFAYQYGINKVILDVLKYPLFLNGNMNLLTTLGKKCYLDLEKKDLIRNIRIVEKGN